MVQAEYNKIVLFKLERFWNIKCPKNIKNIFLCYILKRGICNE